MATRLPAAARRRQLLQVAVSRFAADGFHATAMNDIATAAGVTKPVLYQHFESKRDLYLAVLEDVGERMLSSIVAAVEVAGGPREQVASGFAAYFRFVDEQPDAFLVLFGSGTRSDPEFDRQARRVEDRIAGAVARLIDAEISPDHRQTVAHGIVGLGEVVGRQWLTAGREPAAEVVAARVAELAWSGLRGVRPVPEG
jgi:AcrR family transcriptional regulator